MIEWSKEVYYTIMIGDIQWLNQDQTERKQSNPGDLLDRVGQLFRASSVQDVYNNTLEGACALSGGYAAWLLLQTEGSEALQLNIGWGADLRGRQNYIALGQGLAGRVGERQAAATITFAADTSQSESPYSDARRVRHAIAVPLLRADHTLMGVLQVDSEHSLSVAQQADLRYFAALAVIASERVSMLEDISAGVVSMSVIGTLYSVLNAEAQLAVLEQEIADYAAKQVEGDICLLAIVNTEPGSKGAGRQRRWRVGGLSHDVQERRREIVRIMGGQVGDEQADEEQLARALVQNHVKVNDLLIKPLESLKRQLGTIYAIRLAGQPRFNEREKAAFAYYTSAAAIALDNATLLADNRARLEQIIELKELNENIIRQMGSGVITCDPNGRLMMLNHAAEQLLGWASEQVIAKMAVDVLGLEAEERDFCVDMLRDKATYKHDVHLHTSTGGEVIAELSATPLTDAKGKFSGMIVLINDLTLAREQEAERKRVERLDAIANMAAHVAHEMRNPLGIINLLAQNLNMMLEHTDDAQRAEREDSLRRLQKQVGRLSSMLNEILNFSRPPQLQFVPTDLAVQIGQSLRNHYDILSRHHIKVLEEYSPDLPMLIMDAARIEAVFDNLVRNAAQAMNNGGTLTISARCLDQSDRISDERHVEVIVADTGVGIGDEVLPHIFEPFYTNKAQGTGLGLAIVHRFVEEHNGSVTVSSKVGEGTVFTIKFKVKDAAAGELPPAGNGYRGAGHRMRDR